MVKLAILGDFDESENYPNTRHLLAGIERDPRFQVVLKSPSARKQRNLYSSAKGALGRVWLGLAMSWRAFRLGLQIRRVTREVADVIYVPYPGTLVLFMLSLLPRHKSSRPVLIMDCFISLYDTVVNDRALLQSGSMAARVLKWLEWRAIDMCDVVVVDTQANAAFLGDLFATKADKWQVLNLCINETLFQSVANSPKEYTTVLFVGSFVPLQGAEVVAQAAIALQHRPDIRFQMVGDGQTADCVQVMLDSHEAHLQWQRGWFPVEELAAHYANADICLGVFGKSPKAQRVLPYKVYMALACGKPVINTEVAPLVGFAADLPVVTVPANDASALAASITELADAEARRALLGARSREYYARYLSNKRAVDGFYAMVQQQLANTA